MSKERNVRAPNSIDVVQIRRQTFIGDCTYPNHLVHEALDNAVDEIRNGFGNEIKLEFGPDGSVWIYDSGRGLPKGETFVEEANANFDTLELLFTKLHTGTKFSLDDDNYESLFGQNGIGLVAINGLSEWVDVYTKTDNEQNITHYKFENAKLTIKELKKINIGNWKTIIGFKPSKVFFDKIEYDINLFTDRLKLIKAKFPKSKIFLNQNEIQEITLEDFAREKLELDNDTPIFNVDFKSKAGKISIFMTYFDKKGISCGDVNLRLLYEGTFLNSFETVIKNILPTKLDKKFEKIPERYLVDGLHVYISLTLPEPTFDSQTKVRLTNKIKEPLLDPIYDKIAKIFNNQELMLVIEDILQRKMNKKLEKNASGKNRISAENKLKDCLNSPGDALYIVEGDSADSIMQNGVRDKRTEASLPIRGKIINVEKKSFESILKNTEIKNIIEAIGPKENRRYQKIKILADADSDGGHIAVLLTLIFNRFFSDLVEEGRVSIIVPPLYGVFKDKTFIPVYRASDLEQYRNKKYSIRRFKGLGEMNPKILKQVIHSGYEYVIEKPDTATENNLMKLILEKEEKRSLFTDNYSFEVFLEKLIEQKNNREEENKKEI